MPTFYSKSNKNNPFRNNGRTYVRYDEHSPFNNRFVVQGDELKDPVITLVPNVVRTRPDRRRGSFGNTSRAATQHPVFTTASAAGTFGLGAARAVGTHVYTHSDNHHRMLIYFIAALAVVFLVSSVLSTAVWLFHISLAVLIGGGLLYALYHSAFISPAVKSYTAMIVILLALYIGFNPFGALGMLVGR